MKPKFIGIAVAALILTVSAYADPVTFTVANCGNCGETNILFNTGTQGPLLTITGHTVAGNFPVAFTTTSPNLLFGSGGQSDIDPCNSGTPCPNGLLHSITITVPGGFFTDYILNPKTLQTMNDLAVSVMTSGGSASFGPNSMWGNHLNGQNYLTIKANTGVQITSLTITSAAGFGVLAQNRISGVNGSPPPIPEPSSMLLLGSGVLGLAHVVRRKRL